jgi:hypothetical protein
MGLRYRAFLAGGLGFAVAFVVACGGSNGLLTGDQSSSLNAQLNSVSSALGSHDCGAAQDAATSLNNAVANLPSTVNTTLLQNLGQGAATVGVLAARDCTPTSTPSSSTTSSPSSSSSSSSSSTTVSSTPSSSSGTSTSTTQSSGTATNGAPPGTSSTANGGAGLGAGGTGTAGSGGTGK